MNYKKLANQKLHAWMDENNITERCVVHHRDDTEECRQYNKAHYNMWGFDLDGRFEYGKYVIFMTRAEHNRHHKTNKIVSEQTKQKISAAKKGEKHPMYGVHRTGESAPHYGKQHSLEAKQKMSEASKQYIAMIKALYAGYKQNGGAKSWNGFQKALKTGELSLEECQ